MQKIPYQKSPRVVKVIFDMAKKKGLKVDNIFEVTKAEIYKLTSNYHLEPMITIDDNPFVCAIGLRIEGIGSGLPEEVEKELYRYVSENGTFLIYYPVGSISEANHIKDELNQLASYKISQYQKYN